MRRNRGTAGIDRIAVADVEESECPVCSNELAAELTIGSYRLLRGRHIQRAGAGRTTSVHRHLDLGFGNGAIDHLRDAGAVVIPP